jgi:hypothetical protein
VPEALKIDTIAFDAAPLSVKAPSAAPELDGVKPFPGTATVLPINPAACANWPGAPPLWIWPASWVRPVIPLTIAISLNSLARSCGFVGAVGFWSCNWATSS